MGQHSGSLLTQRIAVDELADSFTAFNTNYHDTGLFGVYAVTDRERCSDLTWCAACRAAARPACRGAASVPGGVRLATPAAGRRAAAAAPAQPCPAPAPPHLLPHNPTPTPKPPPPPNAAVAAAAAAGSS